MATDNKNRWGLGSDLAIERIEVKTYDENKNPVPVPFQASDGEITAQSGG